MNRRDFIKLSMAGTTLSAWNTACSTKKPANTGTQRPNILFLFGEQHHPLMMSPAGNSIIHTPNLQRLADSGLYFENAYCPTPLCMPSRTSTFLGRFSHSTGILTNDSTKDYVTDVPNLARNLRYAGYRTCHVGKTHLGTSWDDSPERFDRLGFEDCYATKGKIGMQHGWPDDPYQQYLESKGLLEKFQQDYAQRASQRGTKGYASITRPSVLEPDDTHDGWISNTANDWLDTYDDERPFYLSINWAGPHSWRDPAGPYASMYEDDTMPPPIEDPMELTPSAIKKRQAKTDRSLGDDPEAWKSIRSAYYGQLTMVDDGIGKILDTLERKGMLENTLVIYSADHGEMLCDHGLVNKSIMYESSVKIPFLVSYPKAFPEGKRPKSFVSLIDLAPTLLEFAGAQPLPEMHGQSLLPVFTGKRDDISEVYSEQENTRMIRQGDWKYINDSSWEIAQLFNLSDDPEELNNRIHDFPEIATRLQTRMEHWY